MRREAALMFDGSDEAAKEFYNAFAEDCDLKGHLASRSSSGSGSCKRWCRAAATSW